MPDEPKAMDGEGGNRKKRGPGYPGMILVVCAGCALSVGALYFFYPMHLPPNAFVWGTIGLYLMITMGTISQHTVIEGCVILIMFTFLGLWGATTFWSVHQVKIAKALHEPVNHSHMPVSLWCLVVVEPVLAFASARVILRINAGEWFP